jgi:hypothetical protein
MSTTLNAYIRPSSRFYGKYEVVRQVATTQVDGLYQTIEEEVIPCHNLSTARSYIEGTREHAIVNNRSQRVSPSIECVGFCSPTGQYYAVVEMPDMDVRIDCHNSATLRGWLRNGVTYATLMEALQDETNVRETGGWSA